MRPDPIISGHCAPQLPEAQREGMSGSRGGIHCDAATAPFDLSFHEVVNV